MNNLTVAKLRSWSDQIQVSDLILAELDCQMGDTLRIIMNDGKLNNRLKLKGGTAVNKLYQTELARLSVDMDFNHVGTRQEVLSYRDELDRKIVETLNNKGKGLSVKLRKRTYDQTTIRVYYTSIIDDSQRWIKLEISHIERVPIMKPVVRVLSLMDNTAEINTYAIEELLATKIRATYDRFKGRDFYDLWAAMKTFDINKVALRKMFIYYFLKDKKIFDPGDFFEHITEMMDTKGISNDLEGFLKPSITFDLHEAAHKVMNELSFLKQLDQFDKDFLLLGRLVLGKGRLSKRDFTRVQKVEFPLASLFANGPGITHEAETLTVEDLKPFTTPRTSK